MFNKKLIALAIFLVTLLAVSPVLAEDNITDDIQAITDETPLESDVGTFEDLSELVQNTTEGNTLKLDKDYKNIQYSSQNIINKSMTIDGDGYTINANQMSGLFYINAENVTLKNINFLNAKSRVKNAGIYVESNARVNIINCNFTNCIGQYGGALHFSEGSTAFIANSSFINCSAEFGGAIYLDGNVNCQIADSIFRDNVAEVLGGCILGSYGNVSVKRTGFIKNTAKSESGGAFTFIFVNLTAEDIVVTDCISEFGGAITLLDSNSTVSRATFKRNSADYDGGAIFAMYGTLDVDTSNFTDNSAKRGAGIYIGQTATTLAYNQFADNSAQKGSAVYSMASEIKTNEGNDYGPNQDVCCEVNDNLTIFAEQYHQFIYPQVNDTELPSYYSMLDYDLLTPVKNQGIDGNCWAFSAMAALESCIKKASNLTLDLSEANLKNLMAWYSDYGKSVPVNGGGSDPMAFGYFASWLGPIDENEDSYYTNDYLSPLLKSILHIQNILVLKRNSYTDNDAIKYAIMKYGAVSTGMFYNSSYLNNRFSYYFNGNETSNHAVCIVGWDDNYSKQNFKFKPSGDGAWIVRNSWGPSWGNNGYFYVSYYDTMFAQVNKADSYTFILNDTVRLNRVYQYEIELTDYIGYYRNNIAYKNVFTVEGDEYLAAVSTYFEDECSYELKVYVNDEWRDLINGNATSGYFTINLNEYIHLNSGDKVTVEFNCTRSEGMARMPISVKDSLNNLFLRQGVSFYWNGYIWKDVSLEGRMACIKIFTSRLDGAKQDPVFKVESEADEADGCFIIRIILPGDATGNVTINQHCIDISTTRSIRLYDLNTTNNVLHVKYSGDDKYLDKSIYHVVDVSILQNGTFDEMADKISGLKSGEVLNFFKDYYFESTDPIYITESITIDGHGHTIDGCNMSKMFEIYARGVTLKNIRFANALSDNGTIQVVGANCTIMNCTFTGNFANEHGGAITWHGDEGLVENCTFISNSASDLGGAVCWLGNNGTLKDSRFIDNSVLNYNGGAVFMRGKNAIVSGCQFTNNSAPKCGGAMDIEGDGATIQDSSFLSSSADNGGALSVFRNEIAIENCNFTQNEGVYGGAIYTQGNYTEVSDSIFSDNLATSSGGAIYLNANWAVVSNSSFANNSAQYGGAISVFRNEIAIENCNFTQNEAAYGGAIYTQGSNTSVFDSSFSDNSATSLGGAIYTQGNNTGVFDSSFSDNSATSLGGAIYIRGNYTKVYDSLFSSNSANSMGGAIYLYANRAVISNSSFANNSANDCGALAVLGNENVISNSTFDDNVAIRYYGAIYCSGKDCSLLNSTFINTLKNNPIIMFDETGTIEECRFLNTTTGNIYYKGDKFIRNDMGLKFNNTSFEYTYPQNVSIYSDILKDVPTLNQLNVMISGDGTTVTFALRFKDGVASLDEYLANLAVGVWSVKATVGGDENYYDGEITFTITVGKIKTGVNLTAEDVFVNHESTLTAIVSDSHNATVNEGKVTFFDGETLIGESNLNNGVATFKYTPKTDGEHTISAVYDGNVHLASNSTHKMLVDSITLRFNADAGKVGYPTTFTVHVDGLYSIVDSGSVSFYINGKYIAASGVENGVAVLNYTPSEAGNHTVKVTYDNLESSSDYAVAKADSKVQIDDFNGTVGSEVTLTAHVDSFTGQTINDGTVTFLEDTNKIGEANVNGGTASIRYVPASGGQHTITAVYAGNNYLTSNDTCTCLIDTFAVEVHADEGTVGFASEFVANVVGLYSTVDSGFISFYLGDEFIGNATIENGAANFTYVPSAAGNAVVKAVYEKIFMNVTSYAVNPADSQTVLADIADCIVGDRIVLTANVTSSNKLSINEGTVTFTDNGIVIGSANVKNGIAALNYVASKYGSHLIRAEYKSGNYITSNDSRTISVERANATVVISNVTAYYNRQVTVSADVFSNGNPVCEGTVTFYINGAQITSVNVADGHASFVYTFQDVGPANVSAAFNDSDNYMPSEDMKEVNVEKMPTGITSANINVVYNAGGYLTATLKDANGDPLSAMRVLINNKASTTDSKGQVKYSANGLVPKTYTMSVVFAGNDKYAKSSASAKIVVKKASSKLTLSKKTYKAKLKTKKYAVTLKDGKGKAIKKAKLTLTIKGKKYKATTNSKGKATFKITKFTKKGKFTATVKFGGTKCYNKVSKNVKITIKK